MPNYMQSKTYDYGLKWYKITKLLPILKCMILISCACKFVLSQLIFYVMWHNSQINSCLLVQIKHVIDTFNIYANKQYICFVKSISFSYKSSLVKVHVVVIEIFTAKQSMIFLIKTFDYALLFLDGVMKIFLCLIDFNQRLIIF